MELEPSIQGLIDRGDLSYGHGRALLAAASGPQRLALATLAATEGWSVRRTEREAAKFSAKALERRAARAGAEGATEKMHEDWGRQELERQLGEHLGTKVRVQG